MASPQPRPARGETGRSRTPGPATRGSARRSVGPIAPSASRSVAGSTPEPSSARSRSSPRGRISRRSSVSAPAFSPNMRLCVGARVFVQTKQGQAFGTVRHYGPVEFNPGTWVGLELDTPLGLNDGVVKDVRYFQCKPNHGLFVKPDVVEVMAGGPHADGGGTSPFHRVEEEPFVQSPPSPGLPEPEPTRQERHASGLGSSPIARDRLRDLIGGGGGGVTDLHAPPSGEMHDSLLQEKWLVDLLVELVAQSDLLQDKVAEHVKQQLGDLQGAQTPAVSPPRPPTVTEEQVAKVQAQAQQASRTADELGKKVQQLDHKLEGWQHDMRELGSSIANHFKTLEEKIENALTTTQKSAEAGADKVSQAGVQAQVTQFNAALQLVAQAAIQAKGAIHDMVEDRIGTIDELRDLAAVEQPTKP